MATISKFYLRDAVSPNQGVMPSFSPAASNVSSPTGDASGAATARDAHSAIGSAQTSSLITSNADTNAQTWGHRRFVSRPLAAQTLPTGNWTLSYARAEANLNHNQAIRITIYAWDPVAAAPVGGYLSGNVPNNRCIITGTEPTAAATEQTESVNNAGANNNLASLVIAENVILVFDILTTFTQAMGTAYTDNFYYDGTTEASATNSASFVTPPAALTLKPSRSLVTNPRQRNRQQMVGR